MSGDIMHKTRAALALPNPDLIDAAFGEVAEWEQQAMDLEGLNKILLARQEQFDRVVAANQLLTTNANARAEAAKAEADRLKAALEMLWTYYLLPISDEQKAQVVSALAPADRNTA